MQVVRHKRWPAVLVLGIAVLAGAAYVSAVVLRERSRSGQGESFEQLAAKIQSGHADATIWHAYGDQAMTRGEYRTAAIAYRKVLEMEQLPDVLREVRVECASALARCNGDEFYAFIRGLVGHDPKLALDLLAKPEALDYMKEPRFVELQKDANAQRLD